MKFGMSLHNRKKVKFEFDKNHSDRVQTAYKRNIYMNSADVRRHLSQVLKAPCVNMRLCVCLYVCVCLCVISSEKG